MSDGSAEKAKAVTLAGDTAFRIELAGSYDGEIDVGNVEHTPAYVNDNLDIQIPHESIQDDSSDIHIPVFRESLDDKSVDEWLADYDAAEDRNVVVIAKHRATLAKSRERAAEKRFVRANTEQPPELDIRDTGAVEEFVFEHAENDDKNLFMTRILDVAHPALLANDGALLERVDLSVWHGVFRTVDVYRGKTRSKKMVQIASVPFEVSKVIVDEKGGFAVELRYMPAVAHKGEQWKTAVFRVGDLINTDRRAEAWQQLANDGLIISRVADAQVIINRAYTNAMKNINAVARGSTRSGWFDSEFCADNWQTPGAPSLINKRAGSRWETAGDREVYLDQMRTMLSANPTVSLVCGYFAAGSIIAKVGAENFLLQLIGRSTAGKTLAIMTALSMRGKPKEFVTFDGTGNAIKSITLSNNDQGMVLDETGQWNATPEQKHSFVYDISQGKARRRLNRNMAANDVDEKAHYSVILTGEEDLLAGVKSAAAGTAVRLTTLYFDPSQGRHLWDSIREATVAEDWELFLVKNHGWLMPMVIDKIREWGDDHLIGIYRGYLARMREHVHSMIDAPPETILRKVKLMAAALTGTQILSEVLGFNATGTFERALELSELVNKEAIDAGVETDNYGTALRRTVDDIKNFLQPSVGQFDKVSERPWGELKIGADGKMGLRLIQTCTESFCRAYGITDKGRFLTWARDNGVLEQHGKGKDASGKPRFTDVTSIKVGSATGIRCYVFNLSRLDDIEADEKARAQAREASDYDESLPPAADNALYEDPFDEPPF